jgi:VacB/RNase II family 3'-5' exoribonuclease
MAHDDLSRIAREAMLQRGLRPEFSDAAKAQVQALPGPRLERDGTARDLRGLPWCSIDNDDSLDLDQLSVAEPLAADAVRILVAIADVDVQVKAGTPIDQHAGANTTSVYTAAGIFPMLPERLSTDLTSLNENEDRMAVVADMTISIDGGIVESEVYQAVVRSRAKLTYDGVAAWLDGHAPAPAALAAVPGLEAQLRLQDRVAQALKSARQRRGALQLSTPQARPVFERGVLVDLRVDDKNRAKELIADFMIAANGVTARFLDRRGFPSLRRMLHAPRRWERIVQLAAANGDTLPEAPDSIALDAFLARRRQQDPGGFADLSLAVVKLLGSGEYTVASASRPQPGHFGLAVSDYTHSTAPNRRFPDLVTQRLLKAALAGATLPYSEEQLAALAAHCTRQEDNAAKVERQVRKAAAAVLLRPRIGERFTAIVTGASERGTWVRTVSPVVEGRVVHGAEGMDVGDRVRIELVEVDVERGFIDFRRAAG